VGEVGVHLDYELGAAGERLPEPGDVGGAQPLLRVAVEDGDVVVLPREPVGDLARPVGRAVVDDQDSPRLREPIADRRDEALDVLGLVVGRQHDPDARVGGGSFSRSPARVGHGARC
jgi:hypothetical protein